MSARKTILAALTVVALLLTVLPPAAAASPVPRGAASSQEVSWLSGMLAEVQALVMGLLPHPTPAASNGRPGLRLLCDNTGTMDPNGSCHSSAAPPVRPITPQCDNTSVLDPNGSCHP
jgi:hypothetical protein